MRQPLQTSDINLKFTKEDDKEKEYEEQKQQPNFYLSVKPLMSNQSGISPRDFGTSAYSNLVSRAEWIGQEVQEGVQQPVQEKKRNRSQNYKIASSKASSQEEKLIALFELISERSTRHTVEQLLWMSEDAQQRLKKEVYLYFSRDQITLERKDLETLLQICEVKNSKLDYFLSQGENKIEYDLFKRIIKRLGFMEYPAYSKNLSSSQFLIGVIYRRMVYFQSQFASQGFAMYLLDAIRREVTKIRQSRIRELLQQDLNGETQNLEDQQNQVQGKKRSCRKCLMCPKYTIQWILLKMTLCCFVGASSKHQEVDSQEFSEEISEEELDRLRPSQRKKQEIYEHQPSPEWDEISQHILDETKESLDLYDPKRGIAWRCVTPNIVMLLIKLLEFFSFLSFIWSTDIPWNFSETASAALNSVNGETPPSYSLYLYFYGISLLLAILYTFLVRPAAIKARNGTLGMNKDGLPAKLCTRPFLFSKLVQFMSASFYTFILKNLLDAFSCDYSNSREVVLLREQRVECFSAPHFALMGGALVGILAYYPFATFLYANLQFINKDTDLKYHPQFMVYLAQAKLIFSSLASFLHSSNTSLIIRITLMAATALFLAIKSAHSQPCLVKSANIFHTAGYLSISHLILMTIFIVLSVNNFIVIGLMVGGVFIIWLVVIILSCKNRSHKAAVQREEVS